MKFRSFVVLLILQMLALCPSRAAVPVGTAFNYQGLLKSTGTSTSGNFDFQFALFDAATNGIQIGPTVTNFNVPVNAGLFSTAVDFGPGNFTGNALWLAIGVRSNGTSGVFISLFPLQPLTPTPNALFARNNAQDTNALASIALLNSTITSATNGLGSMAYQPTNGPQFTSAINYGPFAVDESTPGSNDEHISWAGVADIWYNFAHSVEPEWQFASRGSVSWTIGQDGQGKAINHFGGSAAYHSLWYMQYDDLAQTSFPGHSTPFGYVLHLNKGSTQIDMFGYWMSEQDPGFNQTYRLNWHDYGGVPLYPGFHQSTFMPRDHIAGGLGSNTIYWGGAELTNAVVRGNATIYATNNQFVDFSPTAPDFITLNALGNLALIVTNLNYTNKSLVKEIILHNTTALSPLTLSLPTNWLTLTSQPTSGNSIPVTVPVGNDLHIQLLINCSTITNVYATYSYAWNPVQIDVNAQNFFNAVGGGLSTAASNAMIAFTLAAKAHGYWSNLIAFYPFAGGTSNSCSWNLVNPSLYRIGWHGSSATNFTANGIYGDGNAFYGDATGLVPATALASYTNSSVGAWIRGPALPNSSYFYGVTGANGMHWGALNAGGAANYFEDVGLNFNNSPGSGLVYTSGNNFIGLTAQNLKSASVEVRYLNGLQAGGTAVTALALPTANDVYILAANKSPAAFFSNANLAGFYVAQNMTDQNMADLNSDWAVMNSNLGR